MHSRTYNWTVSGRHLPVYSLLAPREQERTVLGSRPVYLVPGIVPGFRFFARWLDTAAVLTLKW